jgi:DNA-binding transcriptional LysR family regulator
MALDGHGIALLADWHVGDDLRSGKLLEAFADWTVEPSSGIYAVYPKRKYRAHRPKLYRSSQGMDGDPPD